MHANDQAADPHWSVRDWTLLANVRGRKGETDFAYVDKTTGSTLLVRYCPSLTDRRAAEARAMLLRGDFAWVIVLPRKQSGPETTRVPGLEILDKATFRAHAAGTGIGSTRRDAALA